MPSAISLKRKQARYVVSGLGESQKLSDESGGLQSCIADFFGILSSTMGSVQSCQKQIAVEQHSGQEIVEVVGDAAGQTTHGFKAFGLATAIGGWACAYLLRHGENLRTWAESRHPRATPPTG